MTFRLPDEGVDLQFPMDSGCLGCSPTNPIGLRLPFHREGTRICGVYRAPKPLCGGPDTVHGGILALILDEYSCAAGYFLTGETCVTGSLNVRYERPAAIEIPLEISAEIVDRSHPKYLIIDARISFEGALLASSTGRFFPDRRLSRTKVPS